MTPAAHKLSLSHYRGDDNFKIKKDFKPQKVDMKPSGLWVSVDGEYDWPEWCRAEDFNLANLEYRFKVELAPEANLLVIDSPLDLLDFTKQHGKPIIPGHSGSYQGIDWPTLAKSYDGIIIAPYQWSCRLLHETFWYYGWDCASGCIWNPNAIAGMSLMTPMKIKRITKAA